MQNAKLFQIFILHYAHIIVFWHSPNLLSFGNENKNNFILHFAYLTLALPKLLMLENKKKYSFFFCILLTKS